MSRAEPSLAVLMFHHVGPARAAVEPSLTVAPGRFCRFLDLLVRARYTTLDSGDVAAWLHGNGTIGPRCVHVTFDDGYADLGRYALPEVVARGLKATVFVSTGMLGGTNAWDGATEPIMSGDDVGTWAEQGVDFGAHGRTHADLTTLSPDRRRSEIRDSRLELEAILGRPPAAFAYPYGGHDAETRRMVADEFPIAFGVEEGLNTRSTDRMRLRRTMVQPADAAADLWLRARTGHSALQRTKAGLLRMARRDSRS